VQLMRMHSLRFVSFSGRCSVCVYCLLLADVLAQSDYMSHHRVIYKLQSNANVQFTDPLVFTCTAFAPVFGIQPNWSNAELPVP